jgi:nicotinamidase/pyrazinamidase
MAEKAALLVVDVQNGFCTGGGLPVPDGEAVVPVINRLAARFSQVILTQDWHPPGHVSFAASHPGCQPFETIPLSYGDQILWPVHCVQGTPDADFHPGLHVPHAHAIVRKGWRAEVDSYSAFVESDRQTPTGLAGLLRELGVRQVVLCGLATDFCVRWSALDARAAGFEATVVDDACRAIDLNGSLARAWTHMHAAGVRRATSFAF